MPKYLKYDKAAKGFVPDKAGAGKPPADAPAPLQDAGEVPPPHARKEKKVSSRRAVKAVVVAE